MQLLVFSRTLSSALAPRRQTVQTAVLSEGSAAFHILPEIQLEISAQARRFSEVYVCKSLLKLKNEIRTSKKKTNLSSKNSCLNLKDISLVQPL